MQIFCFLEKLRKFAISELLRKDRDEKATRILDTQEEDRNIEMQELFVSFLDWIILIFILVAGTPGFAGQWQLGGAGYFSTYILFLFCDWKTIWSLKYRPIDKKHEKEIDEILKVEKYKYFISSRLF